MSQVDAYNILEKTPEAEKPDEPRLDTDNHQSKHYRTKSFNHDLMQLAEGTQELNALGWSQLKRFRGTGALSDLEQAIEYFSRAVAQTTTENSELATGLTDLGMAYTERFQRLGELEDLEKAIRHISSALTLTPDGHPDISDRHASLGVSYSGRYRRLGEPSDLEKALECNIRALTLTPDGHPDMGYRHANLGVSYTHRYQRLGELTDIEKSIECDTRALVLTPDGHPDISDRHASLGISYGLQYQRLGELADLNKATECHTRALELTPTGHPDMSDRHASLAICYNDRYRHLGELADLDKAMEFDIRALSLTPEGHPNMSRRHASLSVCYTDRYQRLGELADLEKAVEYDTRALALTPDGHPEMPDRHTSLGVSYTDRYRRLVKLADLDKAVEHHTRALALTPEGHPKLPTRHFCYALSLLNRYNHTGHLPCLTNSLLSFRKASQDFTGVSREKFQYAYYWAKVAITFSLSLLNPIEAYQTAIDLLPQFIWLGATTSQRYQDLSLTENLAINACFAAIQSSNYPLALEWLEHARCVVWNQSLMLRSPLDKLHSSYPDLATQIECVANQLDSSSSETQPIMAAPSDSITADQAGQRRRRLAIKYNRLLAQIRQLPGFETFLEPTKASVLMHAVQGTGRSAVVINCHEEWCDALFIIPGNKEIGHLALPSFTEDKARQARSVLEASLKQKGLRQRGVRLRRPSGYEDGIGSVLEILWRDIVKPVLDHLGYMNVVPRERLPHITWCLTGPLSFLPLHAAGDYTQPQSRIFDYAVSSYIPTLSALLSNSPSSLNRPCRMLAVGLATTPGHNPLPGTIKELTHVKAHSFNKTEYSQLTDSQATTTAVLDAMEHHDWVHLACHAHQNVKDPTKSGFYLHNGTLDYSTINRRSFKNKGLAFLSACQTATGDEKLPDEVIHLASGMLMAGYPSVIATMWSVVDEDAPLVADKVYAQLMNDGRIGNGEAGRALHSAVGELREKVGEKEFGRWVPYIHIGS
ncbi:hypothetical protein ACGC1H_007404 [Rhizoctonia solani]